MPDDEPSWSPALGIRNPVPHLRRADAIVGPGWAEVIIPFQPATAWIGLLADPNVSAWVRDDRSSPNLSGMAMVALLSVADVEDGEDIVRSVLRGELAPDDVRAMWRQTIELVTGYPWWEAIRIVEYVIAAWHPRLGGIVSGRIDLTVVSIGQWIDVAYSTFLDLVPSDKVQRIHAEITAPPTVVVDGEDAMDESAFMGAASERLGW